MTIPVSVDYTAEGLNRLLFQFQGKPKLGSLLGAYLRALEATQEDLLYLLNNRGLEVASGAFLDQLGTLVGVDRAGDGDSAYRDAIRVAILINNSEGTPKQVLRILKDYTNAGTVRMFEHYPANVHLVTDGPSNLEKLFSIMRRVLPAAVTDTAIMVNDGSGVVEGLDTAFIASELAPTEFNLTPLVDENGNTLVDNNGNTFVVTLSQGAYTDNAILEELEPYGGGEGMNFVELYDKNR